MSHWSILQEPQVVIVRPYLVLVSSFVVLFGVFLGFVWWGWPGGPIGCVYDEPYHGCYCEAFDIEDVEDGNPGVRQPVNTWFNLYVIFTSSFVAYRMSQDRKRLFGHQGHERIQRHSTQESDTDLPSSLESEEVANVNLQRRAATVGRSRAETRQDAPTKHNLMMSSNVIADWYVLTTVVCGLGKMYFHGSLTRWGTYVDGVSSNVFYAYLPWYTIRRVYDSDRVFWYGYLGTVTLISCVQLYFGSLMAIHITMLTYLLLECYIGATTGVFLLGSTKSRGTWFLAIFLLLVATFFWWSSRTGRFLCDPESFWQPHGLVWHPLAGIVVVLLYLYWRNGDDAVSVEEGTNDK